MTASYKKHILEFKRPSGTSRGVLRTKETWYIIIKDGASYGIGECGILRGLSYDDVPEYESMLKWTCDHISQGPDKLWEALRDFPSIQAGVEMAFMSLKAKDPYHIYSSEFTTGKDAISINGLVWMGDESFMREQVSEKLMQGFNCIKMKIGAIDFKEELAILSSIRKDHDASKLTLRVDANGGFTKETVQSVLKELAALEIHSIEQPIATKQWDDMAALCASTPVPIALDEELIGVTNLEDKRKVLDSIKPQYIILKPSFVGGFKGSEEWIEEAKKRNIGWWITSALESNIGLNAIAQWTYKIGAKGPQGLGTGSLFTNNISSPLEVTNGTLKMNPELSWDFKI